MTPSEAAKLALHEDPEWFREAVNFTAAVTTFAARLIEKDYMSLLRGQQETIKIEVGLREPLVMRATTPLATEAGVA